MTSFNITLKELKRAVKYAKKHGDTKHNTVRLTFDLSSGIGTGVDVSKCNGKKKKDITDVGSW